MPPVLYLHNDMCLGGILKAVCGSLKMISEDQWYHGIS